VGALLLLLIGPLLLLLSGAIWYANLVDEWNRHVREFHPDMMKFAFPLLAVGLFAFGEGLRLIVKFRLRVLVFSGGLLRLQGDKVARCPWDQIEALFQFGYRANGPGSLTHMVRRRDGEEFWFESSHLKGSDVRSLLTRLQEVVKERFYPAALAACRAGETVEFGELGVHQAGLRYGGSFISWSEIQMTSGEDHQGDFTVQKNGALFAWCAKPVRTIPNYCVFVELLPSRFLPSR
jgi:hypothetical protein